MNNDIDLEIESLEKMYELATLTGDEKLSQQLLMTIKELKN